MRSAWKLPSRSASALALGERLRAARVEAGLTQHQLVDGLASSAYLSRIESGQRTPSPDLLRQFCERLGVTSEDLLRPDEANNFAR